MAVLRLAATAAGTAQVEADLARARAAAEAGIWRAAVRLAAQPQAERAAFASFESSVGRAQVRVRAEDEDGRTDLNAAGEPVLATLFAAAGLAPHDAAEAAACLMLWRRSADGARPSSRLRSVGAIARLVDLPPDVMLRLRDLATVHTGRPAPAADAARQGLGDVPSGRLRAPGTGEARGLRTPSLGAAAPGRRRIWRLSAEASLGGTQARLVAVLDLGSAQGMPGTLLEWQLPAHPDGADLAPQPARDRARIAAGRDGHLRRQEGGVARCSAAPGAA